MANLLAQNGIPIGNITGIGPIGQITSADTAISGFTRVISQVIGVITIVGGLWFTFQVITSAISWIGAGGDKQSVQTAQKRLTNALVGLTITILAYVLIGVVGKFLGLDIMNVGPLIRNIGI